MNTNISSGIVMLLSACIITTSLSGCNTRQPRSQEQFGYHRLTGKENHCTTLFEKDGLLYIAQKDRGTGYGYISIYNRKSGAFAKITDINPASMPGCPVYPNFQNTVSSLRHVSVYYLSDRKLRKLFDNGLESPHALIYEINDLSPYFVNTMTNRYPENISTHLDLNISGNSLDELATQLRHLDPKVVSSSANERKRQLREERMAFEQRKSRERMERKREQERKLLARFEAQSRIPYEIGDAVCTYDNKMGFVEKMTKNKAKVHIVGKGIEKNGLLFDPKRYNKHFYVNNMDKYYWFPKREIAHCKFRIQ